MMDDTPVTEKEVVYLMFLNNDLYDSVIHASEDDAWHDLEDDANEPREALAMDGYEVKAFRLTPVELV